MNIRLTRFESNRAVYTLTRDDGTTETIEQRCWPFSPGYPDGRPTWQWNGSLTAPTLTPSFDHRTPDGIRVHLWLTRGEVCLCADSDVQTVTLEPR